MKTEWDKLALRTVLLGSLALLLTGCSAARSPMSTFNPWSQKPPEAVMQQRLAAQQSAAKQATNGKESSLYPPEMASQAPLPRNEKDLKQPTQLHLTYAKLQEQLGHFTEARSSYEKVISREPKSTEALIGLARLDALAGRHPQAEARFRQAVELSNASPEALFALGKYMAEEKRYTEAIVELQKAARADVKNPQYRYELGLTLARAEQLDESIRTLSTVVSPAEANYNVGYIVMKELNRSDIAEGYLNRSLELDPDLKHARYWLTQIKTQQNTIVTVAGTEPEQGQHVYNAIALQSPQHTEARYVTQAIGSQPAVPENLTPEQQEQWKNQVQPQ